MSPFFMLIAKGLFAHASKKHGHHHDAYDK